MNEAISTTADGGTLAAAAGGVTIGMAPSLPLLPQAATMTAAVAATVHPAIRRRMGVLKCIFMMGFLS